jgi:hypothetical protein
MIGHAPASVRREHRRLGFWILALTVAAIRVYECARLPSETGDIVRNLLYGLAVHAHGFSIASEPLTRLSAGWSAVAWAQLPYNYPPVALAFFALIASVSPTVFFAKIALTAIEAVNAILVKRISGSGLLAFVYWCSPLSMWWVSKEGQFEPLQALFMLLALLAAASRPFLAGFSTALGVSAKATAAAVAPWVLGEAWRRNRHAVLAALGGFALGLLPIAFSEWAYAGV